MTPTVLQWEQPARTMPDPRAADDYQGLAARVYDAIWENEYDDLPFYSWLLGAPRGRLLELGCGTGRILLPLAMEGWNCEGVDASADMLAICRNKADADNLSVRLHRQKMERLNLDRKFDRIIIPGFTFHHLTDIRLAGRTLRRIRAHLKPRGRLVLSLFLPWETLQGRNDGAWRLRSEVDLEDGGTILTQESVSLNPVDQLMTVWNRYEVLDPDGTVRDQSLVRNHLRWFGLEELQLLLREAGFGRTEVYGDFTPSPPTPDTTFLAFDTRPERKRS